MEIVKDKTKINEFVLENNKAKVVHNIPARIFITNGVEKIICSDYKGREIQLNLEARR